MMMKYRVSDVAKDLNVPSKEIIELLSSYVQPAKKSATALEENELDIIFEHYTQKYNTNNLDAYFAEVENRKKKPAPEKKAEPAKAEAPAKPAAPAAPAAKPAPAAPAAPAKPAAPAQKPAAPTAKATPAKPAAPGAEAGRAAAQTAGAQQRPH